MSAPRKNSLYCNKTTCLLLIAFSILIPLQALSAEISNLFVSTMPAIEIKNPEVFIDSGKTKTIKDFFRAYRLKEEAIDSFQQSRFSNTVWLRFHLVNHADLPQKVVLVYPMLDSVFVHLNYKNRDSLKISGRFVYQNYHTYFQQRRTTEVFLSGREEISIVVCLVPVKGDMQIRGLTLTAMTEGDFYKMAALSSFEERRYGNAGIIFLGMVLFQLLFITLQGIVMRRIEYFYYVCYALSIGLYYLARYENPFNLNIFYYYFPAIHYKVNDFLLFLPFFFYYRFGSHFCEIKKHNAPLFKKVIIVEKFILLFCFTLLLNEFYNLPPQVLTPVYIFSICILLVVSVYFLIKVYQFRNTISRMMVIGSSMVLLSTGIANLATFSKPLYYLLPVYPLELTMIGVIAEMIIFNAGLVIKTRQIEREQFLIQTRLLEEMAAKRQLVLQGIEERDRIAADLHDDIGATLSSISIYSDSAAAKLRMGDHQRSLNLLEQIGKNARTTMNNMSDIVWAINPVNDDYRHMIDKMESFANGLLQSKGIRFDFKTDKVNPEKEVPPVARKSMYLIFKEAINNSVKYSGATTIRVELFENLSDWTMLIEDDGCGFAIDQVKNGNGLRNIKSRAAESGGSISISSSQSGTTLTLKIPR